MFKLEMQNYVHKVLIATLQMSCMRTPGDI